MAVENKIDINIFKIVTRAIAESDDLVIMANHLIQLLVSALEIKGCTLFALNSVTKELEVLASFGMSINYMNKGPVVFDKSIADESVDYLEKLGLDKPLIGFVKKTGFEKIGDLQFQSKNDLMQHKYIKEKRATAILGALTKKIV